MALAQSASGLSGLWSNQPLAPVPLGPIGLLPRWPPAQEASRPTSSGLGGLWPHQPLAQVVLALTASGLSGL